MKQPRGAIMKQLGSVCVTALIFVLAGCAQSPVSNTAEAVFYPPLPQPPKLQYLMMIAGDHSLDPNERGIAALDEFLVGDRATGNRKYLERPISIAHAPGLLYVLDGKLKFVIQVDLATGKFYPISDSRAGILANPTSVTVDEDGLIYVADQGRHEIIVYNEHSEYERSYKLGEHARPIDAVVIGDHVFVSDLGSYEIHKFDKHTGEYIEALGGPGTEPGLFNQPTFMARSPTNDLLVTDFLNYRVQMIDQLGNPIRAYGALGRGPGAIARPKGIDVDRGGNLYITDVGFGMVTVFDIHTGNGRMAFAKQGTGKGSLYMPPDVHIDYDNVGYFQRFVHPDFNLEYIVYVSNALRSVNVYGFGQWTGPLTPRTRSKAPVDTAKGTEIPGVD